MNRTVTAFAPASIGNVGVGYDILGLAFGAMGDRVTARRVETPGVSLAGVSGLVSALPETPARNTALRAALRVLTASKAEFGLEMTLEKGAPMSAGLGGSAASAVAGAMAANALLDAPAPREALFAHALEGERASSDPPPPDNVAAALMGGLVLVRPGGQPEIAAIPLPEGLGCVAVHPDLSVNTADARQALSDQVGLGAFISHAGDLASFILGCAKGDEALIRQGLRDGVIEPQRAHLVPGFGAVKAAALEAGALGASLSGSGPTVFAWARAEQAADIGAAMASAFDQAGVGSRVHLAPLASPGAEVRVA